MPLQKVKIMNKRYTFLVLCTVLLSITSLGAANSHHLSNVYLNASGRMAITQFLDNVLRQIESKKLLDALPSALEKATGQKTKDLIHGTDVAVDAPLDDKAFYELFTKIVPPLKPSFFFYHQLKALYSQKKEIARQIKKILGAQQTFTNCVEIGNPATYLQAVSSDITLLGTIYAIAEQKSATDVVQAFKLRATQKPVFYNQFVPLADYAPISQTIPDQSVELVVCTIGLHHVPVEKLDAFIASISRILKPGGIFILRDHDCTSPELYSLVYAAHSIYNAVATSESIESECNEYRNFQPLSYWIDATQKHNLEVGTQRILQAGDPTLNTLIAFTKQATSSDECVTQASTKLKQSDPSYTRPEEKSHLGANEWLNVDVAQEYGEFINHTPFYQFPYMKAIATYWKTFRNSWRTAAQKHGNFKILTSDHTFMNLFIGVTMTVEFACKSLISIPVRLLFNGEEPNTLQAIIYDPYHELPSTITTLQEYQNRNIKVVALPRYKDFVKTIRALATTNIVIKEIAGNTSIAMKVRTLYNEPEVAHLTGCKREYSWNSVTNSSEFITMLTVNLENISEVIKALEAQKAEVIYIHDF